MVILNVMKHRTGGIGPVPTIPSRISVVPMHWAAHRMRMAIMGAVINPIVILVRPMIGSGTWKERGCMTKIVERKNNTKVAIAKPLISADIREGPVLGKKRRTKVFIQLHPHNRTNSTGDLYLKGKLH